jgi:hypothetical protein
MEVNMTGDEIKIDRPQRGRPRYTPEQAAAAKKEYQKKWYAEHKEKAKTTAKAAVERNIKEKRFICPSCDKCFSKKSGLDIHLKVSKVHIDERKQGDIALAIRTAPIGAH